MGKKILVIEDEAQSRDLFVKCLQAEGFEAIGAENGRVGLQQAQEELPDLVICDIVMPEIDGYSVLTTLRRDPKTAIIPFIFLTGSISRAECRQGMKLGADDYLTKPSTVDELLEAIFAQLKKRATLQKCYTAKSEESPEPPLADTATFSPVQQSLFPSFPQLKEVFDFIEANYHKPITLSDVAQAAGYSRAYLTNLVGALTGQTVNRWIVERRMVEARSLLLETDQSVDQIATAVGYNNACHFFRQFRKHHNTTPFVWKKEHQASVQQQVERKHREKHSERHMVLS